MIGLVLTIPIASYRDDNRLSTEDRASMGKFLNAAYLVSNHDVSGCRPEFSQQ